MMEFDIPSDSMATTSTRVDEALTASYIGSGEVNVLATPMMVALMEAAAMDAVRPYLPEGWTTVGTKVEIEHKRATPAGGIIQATADLVKQQGAVLDFSVSAADEKGMIGQGRHQRRIVHTERFRKKVFDGY